MLTLRRIIQTNRILQIQCNVVAKMSSSVPFSIDESDAFLHDSIGGNDEFTNEDLQITGKINHVDVNHGIVICAGLNQAKIGDLVYLNEHSTDDHVGVVLTLQNHSVRLGILSGNPKTGNKVTFRKNTEELKNMKSDSNNQSVFLNNISDSHMNVLGTKYGHYSEITCILEMLSQASCHWKHWPNKSIENYQSIYKKQSFHHNKNHDDQKGILFSGIPALDILSPMRRGGSMVISGPQKLCTQLATKIANNYLQDKQEDDEEVQSNHHRNRRVIYVNLSHSDTVIVPLVKELNIGHGDLETNLQPLTLITAASSSSSSSSFTSLPSPSPKSTSAFSRIMAPYFGLEVAEHAACHNHEDVLLIFDEMVGLTHEIMKVQDALLNSSNHHTNSQPIIKSKVSLSASARSISASLLDRATVLSNEVGGGSVTIVGLMHKNPNYGALSPTHSMDPNPSFDIIKEVIEGYSDSNLSLSYDENIFQRIRSRKANPNSSSLGLSIDWDQVHEMNKLPPIFHSNLLNTLQKCQNNHNKDDDHHQYDKDISVSLDDKDISVSLDVSLVRDTCLGILGNSLRKLLKEHSLVEFAADAGKELGILIQDENENGYRAIQAANRVKKLISQSSPVVDSSSSIKSTHFPSSISLEYQKRIEAKINSKKTSFPILSVSKTNNNNDDDDEDDDEESFYAGTRKHHEGEEDILNRDYEAALSVSLYALSTFEMKPTNHNEVRTFTEDSKSSKTMQQMIKQSSWTEVAILLRQNPGVLAEAESMVLSSIHQISNSDGASLLATQILFHVLSSSAKYIEK